MVTGVCGADSPSLELRWCKLLHGLRFVVFCTGPFYLNYYPISPQRRIYKSENWVSIGSDNGLPPVRRQGITWTNIDF